MKAMKDDLGVRLLFIPKQIGDGDNILVSKHQLERLMLAKAANKSVKITFNKSQLRLMAKQVGSGILDSISGFFKSAASKVGKIKTF